MLLKFELNHIMLRQFMAIIRREHLHLRQGYRHNGQTPQYRYQHSST